MRQKQDKDSMGKKSYNIKMDGWGGQIILAQGSLLKVNVLLQKR